MSRGFKEIRCMDRRQNGVRKKENVGRVGTDKFGFMRCDYAADDAGGLELKFDTEGGEVEQERTSPAVFEN